MCLHTYSQDWFTITKRGTDENGAYFQLDKPLRFDVYRSSTADGSAMMQDSESFAKAMPIAHVVHHVGIEVCHSLVWVSVTEFEFLA